MAATPVLGTGDLVSCGFESHLEHQYIFYMSARRARITTKLLPMYPNIETSFLTALFEAYSMELAV